jgi:hypothetical protein
MHRLKASEDISFLVGVGVEQICVSTGAFTINGEGRVSIKMFGGFALAMPGRPLQRFEGRVEDAAALFPLLADRIGHAVATAEGGLQLKFQSGAVLIVFDEDDHYESFTIENDERLIVI